MKKFTDLSRRLANLIRIGTIHSVDYQRARVRVNTGQIVTDWIVFATHRAGTTATWSPPTIGEQCVILAPSGELTTAIVLTAIYQQSNDYCAPSSNPDLHLIQFADGAIIQYDQSTSELNVSGIKTATIEASESITCDTPMVTSTGDLTVNGNVKVLGGIKSTGAINSETDVTVGKLSMKEHTHGEVRKGDERSGTPL